MTPGETWAVTDGRPTGTLFFVQSAMGAGR